jgi:hypothetical protein
MHRLSGWSRPFRARRTTVPILVAGLVAAVAVVAVPGTGTARTDSAAPGSESAAPWDRDALKVAATRDVPGFGGAYVNEDGSTLHVWLTRPTADGALRARTALAPSAGSRLAAAGTGAPVVHRADYTFAQLKTWRDAARALLVLPGVTLLDIDERTNRLMMAVEDTGRHGPAVRAGLARLGVPWAAVRLERNGAVTPTVGDEARPLRGGVKIQYLDKLCTLGFIAQRAGVTGFVTNSHCSTTFGGTDSGKYWQPKKPADSSGSIGAESVDPGFTAGGSCPAGQKCRSSDANFVSTVSGMGVSQGHLARPPLNSTIWNGIDTFRIVAVRSAQFDKTVEKVGISTGRTQGKVTADCVDTPTSVGAPTTMLCQDMASYKAAAGDSGGPVYEIIDSALNTVALVGIQWGLISNTDGQPRALYSPFSSVESELGNLSVCSDPTFC